MSAGNVPHAGIERAIRRALHQEDRAVAEEHASCADARQAVFLASHAARSIAYQTTGTSGLIQ